MGHAKSYAERLFEFPQIGALAPPEAKIAIAKPAAAQGVVVQENALKRIVQQTPVPVFSGNGANMRGMPTRRSRARMLTERQRKPSPRSTKVLRVRFDH
jgi:hypothetical protein